MFARLRPSPALIMFFLALVVLGGTAVAVTTSLVGADGKIHACVGKGGVLSVVKPGTPCPRGESALSWIQNVSGPAGGDLRGSYPNPTLRPARLVGFATQPPPPAASVPCLTNPGTLCGNANQGNYWNQPPNGYAFSGYWVDAWGFVHLEGSVQQVGAPGGVIVYLPDNLHPAGTLYFAVPDIIPETSSSFATVGIDSTTGEVFLVAASQPGHLISLSGITYHP